MQYIINAIVLCKNKFLRNAVKSYSYLHNEKLHFGDLINVPFGSKNFLGVVLGCSAQGSVQEPENNKSENSPNKKNLKKVNERLNINIASSLIFANVIADYYLSSVQEVLKMIVPISLEMLIKVQNENIQNDTQKDIQVENNIQNEKSQEALKILKTAKKLKESEISLTKEQILAVNEIRNSNVPVLLEGVTGSGKTEVYFAIIRDAIESGKQVLFLVPEIALTNQTVLRFKKEFGFSPILWHSGISSHKKRAKHWLDIQNGNASIVVGARSASFLPFSSLGLIVIDEEHDTSSYKQDSGVSFHARDALIFEWLLSGKSHATDGFFDNSLAELSHSTDNSDNIHSKVKMILGSATPSIESICRTMNNTKNIAKKNMNENINASQQLCQDSSNSEISSSETNSEAFCEHFFNVPFKHVKMNARFKETQRNVSLVDMSKTQKGQWISAELRSEIMNTIRNGEQVFLYLNRRGYSPHILCVECKEKIMCKNCATWLVYYSNDKKFKCNLCGYEMNMLTSCASCNGKLVACGPGVERVEKELKSFFGDELFVDNTPSKDNKTPSEYTPSEYASSKNTKSAKSRIAVITSDTKKLQEVVNAIHNNEINVFIATQILAKGHHFPNLTLVGVIDADAGMYGGDFRAPEKTYQLLTQVIGRSAREKNGKILLQTYFPQDSKFTSLINDINKDMKNGSDTNKSNNKSDNKSDININSEKLNNEFLTQEIDIRKQNNLPPFYKFISISVRSRNSTIAYELAHRMYENIHKSVNENISKNMNETMYKPTESSSNDLESSDFKILGPSKHAIYYMNRTYRWNLLITVRKYDKAFRDSLKIGIKNATEGMCLNMHSNMRLNDEDFGDVEKNIVNGYGAKQNNNNKTSSSDYTIHIDVDPQSF